MRVVRWRSVGLLVLGIATMPSASAFADGPPSALQDPDTQAARRHYDRGVVLYNQERYADAAREFDAARRIKPLPAFDYNIGRADERLEQWGAAADAFERYVATLPDGSEASELRARIAILRARAGDGASTVPDASPSLTSRWWFWTAIGVVVVAGADHPTSKQPVSVAIGDLNGDGKPDLAVADDGNNTVSVLLNQGGGTFAAKVDYPTNASPTMVALGDFNGDGRPDLAVANVSSNMVSVLLNQGAGTFAPRVDYPTAHSSWRLAVGDLNGDGKPDIVVACQASSVVSVFLNQGAGTFAAKVDYATGTSPNSVAIGDLNGDGKPDLAVADAVGNAVSILLNQGSGTVSVHGPDRT